MEKPYIGPEVKLPELTVKAVLLGAMLSIVLSAANAYFGLFAGLTVSASIPAAVISMAILKLFRNSNVLENNLVQTAASAGEALAAGVIFTIPALVLMGYWEKFNYFETTLIAISGGVLGVLFTIPLRNALIVREALKFPEGVATAEVLKTGDAGGKSVRFILFGAIVGALFKIADSVLNLWGSIFEKAVLLGNKGYLYYGMSLSPALISVGYIVGLNTALLVFLGGVISWYIAIPAYIAYNGAPEGMDAVSAGYEVWSSQIRYLGVGAMVVGGLWTLISLRKTLLYALSSGISAFQEDTRKTEETIRTERDAPMSWVIIGVGLMVVPIALIYLGVIKTTMLSLAMTFVMIIAGFLFSAVAGYMAGLVGSSNNPISGVTIATILLTSLILAAILGTDQPMVGAAVSILVGAVVACASAIGSDNMQDLKAGHILGATPFKQQIMQMIGVVAGALVIAPVLNYLLEAYGIGAPTPGQPNSLTAPQAGLMQSVATGIFSGDLPWNMVYTGAGIGAVIIAIDQVMRKIGSSFKLPVLAVAVGIYLPFQLDSSIFIGGLLAYFSAQYMKKKSAGSSPEAAKAAIESGQNAGLLAAAGLITGEALMGVLVAIGIVAMGDTIGSWRLFEDPAALPGLILLILVMAGLFVAIKRAFFEKLKS